MDEVDVVEPLRFRRMPMLAAALCFAAGDVLARRWQSTVFLFAVTLLLSSLALISLRWIKRVAAIPVLGLWIIVGCWCAQIQLPVVPQTALTRYADGLSRMLRGRVVRMRSLRGMAENNAAPQEPQEPWRMEPGAWEADTQPAMQSMDLDVQQMEEVTPDASIMRPVQGGARVTLVGAALPLACGDVLELPLRLRVPETYRDPGAWSQADALLDQGIAVLGSAKAERVNHLTAQTGPRSDWRCRVYAAQSWAANRIQAYASSSANLALPAWLRLTGNDVAMLSAMLLGDRSGLRPTVRAGFERTGTFHLFVVSGLHIVLLCGGLFWLLRRMRAPHGVAVTATLAIATGYALLTGFGVPVQRALGMTAVYLLARWLYRDTSSLNALGVAALAVLVLDPRALFEASFQMTFLVIFAIAGLAVPIAQRAFSSWRSATYELKLLRLDAHLPPRVAELRVRMRMFGAVLASVLGRRAESAPLWLLRAGLWLAEALVLGASAEICMVLPMAVYFHRATLMALPLNLLAVPLVMMLLSAAVPMLVLVLISARLAMLPAMFTALLLHGIDALVGHFGAAPFADLRVPAPAVGAVAASCAAIAFCCWALRARRRGWRLAGFAVLAVIPLTVLWPEPPLLHRGTLEVTALDVGQGDSLFIASPTGATLLVDAGGPVGQQPSADRWDVGEEVVAPYLWSRRIRRLDAVLLTHAHSDHMGGMPAILRDFHPRELWLSVQPGDAPGLLALREEAQQLGIQVRWLRAGDAFTWGGLQASVLAPETGYANPRSAVNDDSLVMMLTFGKARALLEGDAETPSENAMLEHARLAPVTLLKVGHHGSKTSTTPAFLGAVAPRDAVISVGQHNTFGHPRFEVLERLEAAHVETFRTDREGAETFLLTGDGGISALPAASN